MPPNSGVRKMSQEALLLGACWAFAGAWLLAMYLYPDWYRNAGRIGDTIGAAYVAGKLPMRCLFVFIGVNTSAFLSLRWQIALFYLAGQVVAAGVLLTLLRSRVQWMGFFGALAGIVAAIATIVKLGRPLPIT